MSADDYDSWQETRLFDAVAGKRPTTREAVARDKAGVAGHSTSIKDLREMAGGQG